MGMRPWKVNMILSLDGFRVCITGIANKGKILLVQNTIQFKDSEYWEWYVQKIGKYVKKIKNNSSHIYDEKYDKVGVEKNKSLYGLYIKKLEDSIYGKRMSSPLKTLVEGKEKFAKLEISEQCQVLLNIHAVFGRLSGGTDLRLIGGSQNSAKTTISFNMSNWGKCYSDVRIIDQSPSGLWERRSQNLLELL
jgi:CRISPR-associated endonuclease Csn1